MAAMRIIGFGNVDRGDDAAGLLVAHRLRDMGIPAQEATGELLALMNDWDVEEPLVLVDAAVGNAEPGEILRLHPGDLPRHKREFRFSTHGLGVADLVGMASALGRLPRKVVVLGIVGNQFDVGYRPGRAVLAAVEAVVAELAAAWHAPEDDRRKSLFPVAASLHREEDAPGP